MSIETHLQTQLERVAVCALRLLFCYPKPADVAEAARAMGWAAEIPVANGTASLVSFNR